MDKKWIIPVIFGTVIGLTGCGKRNELTIQNEAVPVVTVETAVSETTVSSTETDDTAANDTETTSRQTTFTITSTSAVTGTGAPASDTAAETTKDTAAQTRNSSDAAAVNLLYGKWETVFFSKDSGERISYDLSDPVHRSYYVALDLNQYGQSALTVGTESHPATISEHDNILTVNTVSLNNPVSMVFTVSEDRTRMTVELLNGRVVATLKRVDSSFSILDYLTAPPKLNIDALTGNWYYLDPDHQVMSLFVIQEDGIFTETHIYSDLVTSGTVKAENDSFAFYDSENNLYLRFTPDSLIPNAYQDDNPEDGKLVRVDDYEEPNEWGYYDPVIPPVSSISVAALYGIWKNADDSGDMLEIYEGRTLYHGRFERTNAAGKVFGGSVRLQYRRNQDGEKEFCFTFYADGVEEPFALKAVDTIQLNDLYGYPSGEPHFIRQES